MGVDLGTVAESLAPRKSSRTARLLRSELSRGTVVGTKHDKTGK